MDWSHKKSESEESTELVRRSSKTGTQPHKQSYSAKLSAAALLVLAISAMCIAGLQLKGLRSNGHLRSYTKVYKTQLVAHSDVPASPVTRLVNSLAAILEAVFGTFGAAVTGTSEDINCEAGPSVILGRPTASTVSLNLLAEVPTTVHIGYAVEGASLDEMRKTEYVKVLPHSPATFTLTNLEPSTRYVYGIWFKNSEECEERVSDNAYFHTQRYSNEAFTFAVIADTHLHDPGAYDEEVFHSTLSHLVMAAHDTKGYDFMLDMGDTFMGMKLDVAQEDAYNLYENVFKLYSPAARSSPLFLINGNHDGELGAFIPIRSPLEEQEQSNPLNYARLRNKYFLNPKPDDFYTGNSDVEFPSLAAVGNYYAWHWGNSLVVVLDPYWYTRSHVKNSAWEWTLGFTQYKWLHSVLSLSPASLKFMFIHQYVGGIFGTERGFGGNGDESYAQYFEWGGKDEDGSDKFELYRPGWNYGPIHQMCVESGVSIVFRGHDHLYHVGEFDGVIYNTLPKTSDPDSIFHEDMATEKGYNLNEVSLTSGHAEVAVTKEGATVTFKAYSSNAIIHQYAVAANGEAGKFPASHEFSNEDEIVEKTDQKDWQAEKYFNSQSSSIAHPSDPTHPNIASSVSVLPDVNGEHQNEFEETGKSTTSSASVVPNIKWEEHNESKEQPTTTSSVPIISGMEGGEQNEENEYEETEKTSQPTTPSSDSVIPDVNSGEQNEYEETGKASQPTTISSSSALPDVEWEQNEYEETGVASQPITTSSISVFPDAPRWEEQNESEVTGNFQNSPVADWEEQIQPEENRQAQIWNDREADSEIDPPTIEISQQNTPTFDDSDALTVSSADVIDSITKELEEELEVTDELKKQLAVEESNSKMDSAEHIPMFGVETKEERQVIDQERAIEMFGDEKAASSISSGKILKEANPIRPAFPENTETTVEDTNRSAPTQDMVAWASNYSVYTSLGLALVVGSAILISIKLHWKYRALKEGRST